MSFNLLLFILFGSLLAGLGTVLIKIGATGAISFRDFANLWMFAGLASYGVGFFLWTFALAKVPLVYAYPFTMLTFVFVGSASVIFLGEKIGVMGLVGWVVILIGFCLVMFDSLKSGGA